MEADCHRGSTSLPGNLDLRAFGGLTPFVVVEHAAIHVVAAAVRLLAGPCGVFVVTLRVVVLSRRLCGEQQEQSKNQMHHADITPTLRFRFGVPFRCLSSEEYPFSDRSDLAMIVGQPTNKGRRYCTRARRFAERLSSVLLPT